MRSWSPGREGLGAGDRPESCLHSEIELGKLGAAMVAHGPTDRGRAQ